MLAIVGVQQLSTFVPAFKLTVCSLLVWMYSPSRSFLLYQLDSEEMTLVEWNWKVWPVNLWWVVMPRSAFWLVESLLVLSTLAQAAASSEVRIAAVRFAYQCKTWNTHKEWHRQRLVSGEGGLGVFGGGCCQELWFLYGWW